MLEVELDIFSGRANPRWMLTKKEEQELVDRIAAAPDQVAPASEGTALLGLGYRGLVVRWVKSDDGPWEKHQHTLPLPNEFRVGARSTDRATIADWLLKISAVKHGTVADELLDIASRGVILHSPPAMNLLDEDERSTAMAPPEAAHFPTVAGEDAEAPIHPDTNKRTMVKEARGQHWWACSSNYFSTEFESWSLPPAVWNNNCYCYASNHHANIRLATPGKRGGHPAAFMSVPAMTNGLYADGWRDGCQPNGLTIALAVWPDWDFHFYRLVIGSPTWMWFHKPGTAPVTNTDACGNLLRLYKDPFTGGYFGYGPANCCRDFYTDFGGYFYQNNYTAYVA